MRRFSAAATFVALMLSTINGVRGQVVPPENPPYQFLSGDFTNQEAPFNGAVGIVGFDSYDQPNDTFLNPSTVTLTMGDMGTWLTDMYAYNGSTVNVPSGGINGILFVFDNGSFNLSNTGNCYAVSMVDTSTATITGGTISGANGIDGGMYSGLILSDSATASISGGSISNVSANGGPVTISGGIVSNLSAGSGNQGNSTVITQTGGTVKSAIITAGSSMTVEGAALLGSAVAVSGNNGAYGTIYLDSATAYSDLSASGGSIHVDGGYVGGDLISVLGGYVSLDGGAQVNLDVQAQNQGTVDLLSGSVGGSVTAESQSTINANSVSIGVNCSENASTLNVNGANIGENLSGTDGYIYFNSGTVGGTLQLASTAICTISNGTISGATTMGDTSMLFMAGGTITGVTANASSIANFTDGTDQGNLQINNSAKAFLSGLAEVQGTMTLNNSAQVFMSGGIVYGGANLNGGTLFFSGGEILGGVQDSGGSFVLTGNVTPPPGPTGLHPQPADGGSGLQVYLNGNSSFEADGYGLNAQLIDANNDNGTYSEYQIGGFFADGTPVASGVELFVQNGAAGANYHFVNKGGPTWNNDNGGSWGDATNWQPGYAPSSAGDVATFNSTTPGASPTVTLDGDRAVGSLTIEGPNGFTFNQGTGGSLILDNNGAGASVTSQYINYVFAPVVVNDNVTINVANSPGSESYLYLADGVTVASGKTITETGLNFMGASFIQGGTLNLQGGYLLLMAPDLSVHATTLQGLNIGSGSATILDIYNNPVVIDYDSNPDPISTILTYLKSGYKSGWNRGSIASSYVGSLNSSQSQYIYSVGYAEGTDGIVSGLNPGELEIMPTLAGDAKLQGDVDFGDFQLLAANFGLAAGWDGGNFTYGSIVNFGDFQLLAQNFGGTFADASDGNSGGLTSAELASMNGFAAQFGEKLVANPDGAGFEMVSVPEPATVGLLAVAGIGLLGRRRRSRRNGATSARILGLVQPRTR